MSTEPDTPNDDIPGRISPDDPTWRPPQQGPVPGEEGPPAPVDPVPQEPIPLPEPPNVRYVIRAFDATTGVADVQYEDGTRNLFFIPVDPQGKYFTGDALNRYIRSMKPPEPITGSNPEDIEAIVEPDPNAPDPGAVRTPSVVAMAELVIDGDFIGGIETAVNLSMAFALEPHLFWVFFGESQPNTAYIVFAQSSGFNVDVTVREADFFELTVTDRLTGEPAVPTTLSISVQRVQ